MKEIRESLIHLFQDAQDNQSQFKRKLYESAFLSCYEKYKELLESMIGACEEAEDKDAVIEELSSVIPKYAHEKMNALPSKRKRENLNMDYNLSMVTFVVPILTYNKNEYCIKIAEKMVEKWNQPPVTMKLQMSSFEDMKAGFKSRLCYITTAVCESQNKTDDCYELQVLRDYRDEYLLHTEKGKKVVERYYDVAPTIVNRINRKENAKEIYGQIYDTYLSTCINLLEQNDKEACGEVYTDMVEELQKQYLYS